MLRIALALLLSLSPVASIGQYVPSPSWDEVDFMKDLFKDLQPISIGKRREYCGYVGRTAEGDLIATEPVPGDMASCLPIWPSSRVMTVTGSYHTHGAFDLGYFNELPSVIDLEGDISLGINGWVATPGGRLWFNDHAKRETRLVCGVGCLPLSPEFYKGVNGNIGKSYSLDQLINKLGE